MGQLVTDYVNIIRNKLFILGKTSLSQNPTPQEVRGMHAPVHSIFHMLRKHSEFGPFHHDNWHTCAYARLTKGTNGSVIAKLPFFNRKGPPLTW